MADRQSIVEIYTDGAGSGNPGPGGWGAVLKYGSHERELSGGEKSPTTNNRMELTAPIQALRTLTRPCVVEICTDSAYVRDGITRWLPRWRANGRRTSDHTPVQNADLWQQLAAAMESHHVSWRWVKGHTGNPGNERADTLAAQGLKQATAQLAPAVADTAGQDPADADDCVHDMPIAWCALCKAPPEGVLPNGYRTGEGDAYHNDPHCTWMNRGQRMAFSQGKNTHEMIRIAWNTVDPGELEPCKACCTTQWLKRHGYRR